MDENVDFIATELLKELKESNTRKDNHIAQMHKSLLRIVFGFMTAIVLIVAGFLVYLNQYDFTSTEKYSYEATGVYALIDSEGNVIAHDLSPEEVQHLLEVLNSHGNSKSNSGQNSQEE